MFWECAEKIKYKIQRSCPFFCNFSQAPLQIINAWSIAKFYDIRHQLIKLIRATLRFLNSIRFTQESELTHCRGFIIHTVLFLNGHTYFIKFSHYFRNLRMERQPTWRSMRHGRYWPEWLNFLPSKCPSRYCTFNLLLLVADKSTPNCSLFF